MKKILALFVLFISINSNAQKANWFFGLNQDSAVVLAKEIMKNFRGKYEYGTSKFTHPTNTTTYFLVKFRSDSLKATDGEFYNIIYQVFYEGENKALEIKGVPRFWLREFAAQFLDVFPFWKEYLNPKADMAALSEKGDDKIYIDNTDPNNKLKYRTAYFRKLGDNTFSILVR